LSTSEREEPGQTAPIAVPPATETERSVEPPPAEASHTADAEAPLAEESAVAEPAPAIAEPAPGVAEPVAAVAEPVPAQAVAAAPQTRDVMYVPLAVSVGDGFKFGCGFFLALVLAMLVGFVLLAALFALTSIFGLNLPLGR